MRSQYGLPNDAAAKPSREDPRGKAAHIRETAKKYGIDPEVALRVAKSEGLASFKSGVKRKDGTEEPSWGAFQLYTGGGLGNKFKKETGLDPADPKNEDATIDYALKYAVPARLGLLVWREESRRRGLRRDRRGRCQDGFSRSGCGVWRCRQ